VWYDKNENEYVILSGASDLTTEVVNQNPCCATTEGIFRNSGKRQQNAFKKIK
jgi:hypothetical protein